jgi:hypothetical protein
MKTTLIIDEKITEDKFPHAIIITKKDAYNVISLDEGQECELESRFYSKAKLENDNYLFYHKSDDVYSLPKDAVDLIVNKYYYLGQKLFSGNFRK